MRISAMEQSSLVASKMPLLRSCEAIYGITDGRNVVQICNSPVGLQIYAMFVREMTSPSQEVEEEDYLLPGAYRQRRRGAL